MSAAAEAAQISILGVPKAPSPHRRCQQSAQPGAVRIWETTRRTSTRDDGRWKLIEVDWSWYDILQETIDFPIKYGAFHWWTNPLMIVNLCEFRGLSGLSKRDCLGRTRRTKRATHAGQDIKDETLKVLHPNKKLDIIGSPFGWWTDEPINPAFKTRLCLRADLAFTGDGKHLVSLSSMPDCTVPSLDPVRWSTTTCA